MSVSAPCAGAGVPNSVWRTGLGLLFLLVVGSGAVAQSAAAEPIRVGYVGPTQTGSVAIAEAMYDLVGDAARFGVLLGEDDVANAGGPGGLTLDILLASTPSAEAARRAARRLILVEGVRALIGGIGDGQAEVLAQVADEHGILFLNIGSPGEALRAACRPHVFHVEASAAMYIDGIVKWNAQQGHHRMFIVHEATEEGRRQSEQARMSIARTGGADVVGSVEVASAQPLYQDALLQAGEAGADVILLLVNAQDQIAFLSQQSTFGPEIPAAPFPHAVTQSREFMAAERRFTGGEVRTNRIALWEATLDEAGGAELNSRYLSRWGRPMEPHAWAGYAAVHILHEAIASVGAEDSRALIGYLEGSDASFDVHKKAEVSFRAWNHQLRQPLYIVTAEDAPWGASASQQLAVASHIGVVPDGLTGASDAAMSDRIGKGPDESSCP